MAKKLFRIETEKIVGTQEGYESGFFDNNRTITSWSGNLSSLADGAFMFRQSSIKNFTGDIGSETVKCSTYYMFARSDIETFTANVINTGSNGMFNGSNLREFRVKKMDCHMLCEGFRGTPLEVFEVEEGRIQDTVYTFAECSNLEQVISPNLTLDYGIGVFMDCGNLKTVDIDTSELVTGAWMFSRSGLTNFTLELPNLMSGPDMFYRTYLTSFNISMPVLLEGRRMFAECHNLESFSSSTPMLIDGCYMFANSELRSFSGDLQNLAGGYGMFCNTNLDIQSVNNICESLPNLKEKVTRTFTPYRYLFNSNVSEESCQQEYALIEQRQRELYEELGREPTIAEMISMTFMAFPPYNPDIDTIGVVYPAGWSHVWERNDSSFVLIPRPWVETITLEANVFNGDTSDMTNKMNSLCSDKGWTVICGSNMINESSVNNNSIDFYNDGVLVSSIQIDSSDEYWYNLLNYRFNVNWNVFEYDWTDEMGAMFERYEEKWHEDGGTGSFVIPFVVDLRQGDKCVFVPKGKTVWKHANSIESAFDLVGIWAGSDFDIIEDSNYVPDASSWHDDVIDSGALDYADVKKVENGFVWVEDNE